MRQVQNTILQSLGKALRVHVDDITHEPLPRRWVELILYLEQQERKRPGSSWRVQSERGS